MSTIKHPLYIRLLGLGLGTLMGMTVQAQTVNLYVSPPGDANYAWNSKYGAYGYTTGGTALSVGLQMNGPYGNDYTMGFMEIPLAALTGRVVDKAELWVHALGFDTYYWYGSAGLGWLNTEGRLLTGDVEADDLGGIRPAPGGWPIWATDMPDWQPGWKHVDVTSEVQLDIAAGRAYSSFFLWGSRDTTGGISAAESGMGPYLNVTLAPIPEADTWLMLLAGLGVLSLLRRKTAHPGHLTATE